MSSENSLLTLCGTPMYIAPEILSGVPYGTKVDMWSLGVIAYVLLTGDVPFSNRNTEELHYDTMRGRFRNNASSWKAVSPEAQDMVASLLVVTPSTRLSAKQAARLSWVAGRYRTLPSSRNKVEVQSKIAMKKFRCAVFTVS